jgi:hypothetical protein
LEADDEVEEEEEEEAEEEDDDEFVGDEGTVGFVDLLSS